MYKAKALTAAFCFAFVSLLTLGAIRNLEAQQNNPGVQQSGAVTSGHATVWGPGIGQVQDGGILSTVTSVFGRTGAVVATLGDYTFSLIGGSLACSQLPGLTGDIASTAGACGTTLATVNANVGAFGGVNSIPSFTVDGKGRITSAAANVPAIPFTELTGFATCAQLPALTGFVTTVAGNCATSIAGNVPIGNGGTGQATATLGFAALAPSPTRAGDIIFWSGSAWVTLPGDNTATLVLQSTAAGVLSWAAAGTGTVTSVTCGTGLSGGTFTSTGTCALALTNATVQAAPANPTGSSSTAPGVMMGLGTTCKITPVYSGRAKFEIVATYANNTATVSSFSTLRFGTGTAPVNGVAATGTQIGNIVQNSSAVASATVTSPAQGIVTGLAPGTSYWFDLALYVNANASTVININCNAFEF